LEVHLKKDQDTQVPVIALDGDAGAGKGTVRQLIAKALRWHELDSGILYRLVAFLGQDAPTEDHYRIIASGIIGLRMSQGKIFLYGRIFTDADLRTERIDALASRVALDSEVRAALREIQLSFRTGPGLVADGRDMGKLFESPNVHRYFITASVEERAKRRLIQNLNQGRIMSVDEVRRGLAERDLADKTRLHSPSVPHPDAEVIDTTNINQFQVADYILSKFHESVA